MTRLLFLGTAPGRPWPQRAHSSLLVERDGERILIDAGEPCSRRLREHGLALGSISAVLITHGHADHVGGLPLLIQGCMIERRTAPLDLWLPRALLAPLQAWLGTIFLSAELVGFPLRWHAWEEAPMQAVGGWEVEPFPTTHLAEYARRCQGIDPERLHAFGFVLRAGGLRWVHSGDLGALSELAPVLREPADLLVCEATHMDDAELLDFLRARRAQRMILTHLSGARLTAIDTLRAQISEIGGDVVLAEDGLVVELAPCG